MEERTQHLTPVDPDAAAPSAPSAPPAGAQIPLPFDDEAGQPIPFALTARARRTVAPEALPTLRVVDGTPAGPAGADDDPHDTRPARARALRRAGVGPADIAAQLGVDELLVRAWTTGVAVPPRSRRAATLRPRTATRSDAAPPTDRTDLDTRLAELRARARDVAVARLRAEPQLGAGLGVLAGTAELGRDAVTVTTRDPRVAGAVVRWLVDVLDADRADVRLVLRVPPRVAADLARHAWARAIDLDPVRIRTTSAGAPVDDDAVEAVLRIVDADLAATAAGWCDALLAAPVREPAF
jgi:hypothetical protein